MDELRKILTALRLPSWWVYKGVNHSMDDNEEDYVHPTGCGSFTFAKRNGKSGNIAFGMRFSQ